MILFQPGEPLRTKRTTGLSAEQFADLLELLDGRIEYWNPPAGRPKELSLAQALKATLMYFKNNITQEVIAELLDVSQPTVSRAIAIIEVLIGDELSAYVADADDVTDGRVHLVDGTLLPCWSWAHATDLWSGKHHTTGHLIEVICDLNGAIEYISDPLPGSTHDAAAFAQLGLADILSADNAIGDKGFIGCGITTPFRKPAGGELEKWQHEFNTTINKLRYIIEREIANFKTWRCLFTDYRRPLNTFTTAFNTIRALHFYKLETDL